MLREKMNVLTIYLPWRKIGIASNLRIVKTAVTGPNVVRSLQYFDQVKEWSGCYSREYFERSGE